MATTTPLRDVTNASSPSARGGAKASDVGAEVRSSARRRAQLEADGSEPECLIWALPEEVIVEILLRLDVSDVCMLARTCTQVGRPIAHPRVWETRTLRLVRAPLQAWSSFGQRLALVRTLKIEPAAVGAAPPPAIEGVRARQFNVAPLRCRAHSAYCPLGAPLHGLPQLTSCGGLTDVGVSLLARMLSNVETLSVAQMGHLAFESIARLITDCPRLAHLDASGCTLVAEPRRPRADAVAAIPFAHPRLVRLNLSRTRLSNAGLTQLVTILPALEELSLNHCEHLDAALGDAAERPDSIGHILAAHSAAHGALRKVSVVGSISVKRESVEAMERAGVRVETDDSFTDNFLQQRPGAEGLFALISTYYNM